MLQTSFRSIGRTSRGLRVVLWGSALEQGLIDPQIAHLIPPHSSYQRPFGQPATELPFVQSEQANGLRAYQMTAADFEIPAGIGEWSMGGEVPSGLSWYRAYDAAQLACIGISSFGQAAAAGRGELFIGMMPLEALEQGMASWRIAIEVLGPQGG